MPGGDSEERSIPFAQLSVGEGDGAIASGRVEVAGREILIMPSNRAFIRVAPVDLLRSYRGQHVHAEGVYRSSGFEAARITPSTPDNEERAPQKTRPPPGWSHPELAELRVRGEILDMSVRRAATPAPHVEAIVWGPRAEAVLRRHFGDGVHVIKSNWPSSYFRENEALLIDYEEDLRTFGVTYGPDGQLRTMARLARIPTQLGALLDQRDRRSLDVVATLRPPGH